MEKLERGEEKSLNDLEIGAHGCPHGGRKREKEDWPSASLLIPCRFWGAWPLLLRATVIIARKTRMCLLVSALS